MTTVRTRRIRLVSILGLLMMLMSITPMGIAAQSGITIGDDVAQATTGPGIELLVGECPPGAPADPSDLVPGCLENGIANLNVQVTSTDPALGINLPKVTERINGAGPGVINTGAIPVGEYKLALDLPVDQNNFFFECRIRGTETPVPVSPSPDGAKNAFLVSTTEGATEDIVCSAFVTSTVPQPTIEITYRECAAADLPGDGRTFEDLDPNCTTVSTNPPTFNVRDLQAAGQPVTQHNLDAEGKVLLTLTPGAFDLFTDLDMEPWDEFLFCEYEGQPRYEKDFNPERGITTFTDLLPGEEIKCDWFAVDEAKVAAAQETVTETEVASETPTETETATDVATEATEAETGDAQRIVPNMAGGPTITITYRECARADMPSDGRTFADLDPNCTNLPTGEVTITADPTGAHLVDSQGMVVIQTGEGNVTLNSGKDMNQWGQYLFCEYTGQPQYQKDFDAQGNVTFRDLVSEQITCDWFAVSAAAPAVPAPSETPVPSPTPTEAAAPTNSNISLSLIACESEESVGDTSSLDAFRSNCSVGIENMVFNLSTDGSPQLSAVTLPTGEASFADVTAGDWRMWSEIPLESATEYYFCADESGVYNAVPLSDRGVASFADLNGDQINCEIYVVPTNLRGEVTGASVEVHLSNCPIDYAGSNWYNDCHANGISDLDFTLTGPNGEVTATTTVPRTPGPGIVNFTGLPAGDYVLAGGPPQDFGTVFLYCSDPATGTQIPTTFDGVGRFTIAENQSVVCDWYFAGENQGAPTPTPTPAAQKAEIFTTMFICPPGTNVAGSTFSQLDSGCAERLSNVPMTLQSPGGVPITANTGESGEGAIRFYDLISGDYVLTPTLPAEYVSAAVYCDLDGVNVYQKALSNGATTFSDVDGEKISCSWFVTPKQQPAPAPTGPTGSITIREMLCEGDRATIGDWERECQPGSSGVSFTITSSNGAVTQTLTPNAEGVAVFSGLPNEYYEIKQSEGAWCRAKAERVDAQSRVIVANGGNTDLFLYQCNQELGLPNTGAGPAATTPGQGSELMGSFALGAVAMPLLAIAFWHIRRYQAAAMAMNPVVSQQTYTRTDQGDRYQ